MPKNALGPLPPRLSETGVFAKVRELIPSDAMLPYDLRLSFWSDGASKLRWVSVPETDRVQYSPTGEWHFPKGTVFVKSFSLATDETHPESKRRLETRLLVCDDAGGVYGVTYKWRSDESDADLLNGSLTEDISIKTSTGLRRQPWYYPSREDCLTCHNARAGSVLGPKTRQLNRDYHYPSGIADNELRTWNHLGLLEPRIPEEEIPNLPKLALTGDVSRSLEERARSYLDVNCAQCHRPQETVAYFDARYDTPLPQQNLIEGQVLINQGVDRAQIIAPKDIWRSILFMRMSSPDGIKMPPLARQRLDDEGLALLRTWIESMPGREVLEPPVISPRGGAYGQAVDVVLQADPADAEIHYTLDGSAPTTNDPLYEGPIKLSQTAIVRARSFKKGWTKSISAQEVFNLGE